MAADAKIRTTCPLCDSHYHVAAEKIGQKARCTRCHGTFQIVERIKHPTEEDILRWINEGMEDYFDRSDDETTHDRLENNSANTRQIESLNSTSRSNITPNSSHRLAALEHNIVAER